MILIAVISVTAFSLCLHRRAVDRQQRKFLSDDDDKTSYSIEQYGVFGLFQLYSHPLSTNPFTTLLC